MTGKRFLQGLAEGIRYLLNFLMETLKILLMSAQSVVDGLDSRLRGRSSLPNLSEPLVELSLLRLNFAHGVFDLAKTLFIGIVL